MPGRLFLTKTNDEVAEYLGVSGQQGPDQVQGDDIAPGAQILVMDETRQLRAMRWGILPNGRTNARGRPEMNNMINARSETVFDKSVYEGMHRCIVPVDGWYEWTGEVRRKTRWRLRAKSGNLLLFAAIYDVWRGPGGLEVAQVATLTCEPNHLVAKIHHRMGVILDPNSAKMWLDGDDVLLDPAPEDLLVVEDASEMEK